MAPATSQAVQEDVEVRMADIKNVGGRAAGATTAALFLQHFVTDDVTWAHLDVADLHSTTRPISFMRLVVRDKWSARLPWAKHHAES